MLKVHFIGRPWKGFSALEARANEPICADSSPLLSSWPAFIAMKYRRAPWPVSRVLEKALICPGLADDPSELGSLPRRYLFRERLTEFLNSASRQEPGYKFSVSLGAARFDPWNQTSLRDLIAEADQAMYEQKHYRSAERLSTAACCQS